MDNASAKATWMIRVGVFMREEALTPGLSGAGPGTPECKQSSQDTNEEAVTGLRTDRPDVVFRAEVGRSGTMIHPKQ